RGGRAHHVEDARPPRGPRLGRVQSFARRGGASAQELLEQETLVWESTRAPRRDPAGACCAGLRSRIEHRGREPVSSSVALSTTAGNRRWSLTIRGGREHARRYPPPLASWASVLIKGIAPCDG